MRSFDQRRSSCHASAASLSLRLIVRSCFVSELLDLPVVSRLEAGKVACHRTHEPVRERYEHDDEEDEEKGEEPKLADPAPLRLLTALPEQHEAPDSTARLGGARVEQWLAGRGIYSSGVLERYCDDCAVRNLPRQDEGDTSPSGEETCASRHS